LKSQVKEEVTMKKFVFISLAIVLVCAVIFSGCPKPAPPEEEAPPPPSEEAPPAPEIPKEIRVGSVASLTGMSAAFGQGGSWGISAAVDDINKLGGVYVEEYGKKIPIKLILLNCESDPVKAGTLTEDLILREKIDFLVHDQEPITFQIESNNIAERYKIPNIAGTGPLEPYLAVRETMTPPWQYTWCYSFGIATPPPEGDPRYGEPGYTILDTWKTWLDLFGDQTNKTIGVYASDDPDGIGWFELFSGALGDWGYNVVGFEKKLGLFPFGTTDFRPLIQEWKDKDVEIIWGNCPAVDFGTLWRQARAMDFKPKMVGAARAALFYEEVTAWGGDLPLGVFIEMWWSPAYSPDLCPGIGDTTPQSLAERWTEDTGQPLNIAIGWSYCMVQVLVDAIERAGTLDKDAVNKAIGETDLKTIAGLFKYDKEMQFNFSPLFIGQWNKTDKPEVWELPVVFSKHDFIKATAEPIFPIPYD
jgi:branched-chain amino acid transport system substrate-binding protein